MNTYIEIVTSRIKKMSKRRQKNALIKQKEKMCINGFPIYVHEPVQFDTSFRYISYIKI